MFYIGDEVSFIFANAIFSATSEASVAYVNLKSYGQEKKREEIAYELRDR